MVMTHSRMIVVLRGELGNQLRLAHKRFAEAQQKESEGSSFDPRTKADTDIARKSIQRIESAIEALGRLTLGDIEDTYTL